MSTASYGKVYLVGAGPGDPGLLTLRGRDCLEMAEAVVYDSLANEELLRFAPHAEAIYVGKSRDRHTLLQEEINRLLIEQATKRQHVVRLKGGDPFIFGRGGEEAFALAEAGVPFEVVPGITSGIAAPAYAGIPLTHRGLAASYTCVTGHIRPEANEPAIDLTQLPKAGTLCFYMAVKTLPYITGELIRLGWAADTPAAAIEWGTLPHQRTVTGTLDTIAARCSEEYLRPPAIVVIGHVAGLHGKLSWYEQRPLFGRRIVVTRARSQASSLLEQLRELGADVFEFPTIQIEPPEKPEPIDPIDTYDWVIFTSVNGVEMLFSRLEEAGDDGREFAGVRICAIGSATAAAVRQRFLNIDLIPEKYVAEELFASLLEMEPSLDGKRFLMPRADLARGFLPEELRKRGAEVTELVAYRTVTPDTSDARADALVSFRPELITFTSSSSAKNFTALMGPERIASLQARNAAFAAIGPITGETARQLGLNVEVEAEQHDIPGLLRAVCEWAARHKPRSNSGGSPDPSTGEPTGQASKTRHGTADDRE